MTYHRHLLALICVIATSPAAAQPSPPPAPVVVDRVISAATEESRESITGHIQARQELTLMALQAGELQTLCEPGEYAQQGQVLAAIDQQPLVLRREEQQARLERSRVSLRNTERRIKRFDALDDREFVSTTELDDLHEQRDLLKADIQIARSQIAQLDDQIKRTNLLAPYDGVVISRTHHPGEYVTPGTVLGHFVGTSSFELRVQMPLRWLGALSPGSTIEFAAENAAAKGQATVRTIIPSVGAESQTYELRADLVQTREQRWPVGQLVSVHVPSEKTGDALMVPRDALVLRREGARVIRIRDDDTAEWVPVTVGRGFGSWIVVSGDLSEGHRIAVRGAERLSAGQSVEILRDLAAERQTTPAAG